MRIFSRTAGPSGSPRQKLASRRSSTAAVEATGVSASEFVGSRVASSCVASSLVASASDTPRSSPRETVSVASRRVASGRIVSGRVELPGLLARSVRPPGCQSSQPASRWLLELRLSSASTEFSPACPPRSVLRSVFHRLRASARNSVLLRLSRRCSGAALPSTALSSVASVSSAFPFQVVSSGVAFSSVAFGGVASRTRFPCEFPAAGSRLQ